MRKIGYLFLSLYFLLLSLVSVIPSLVVPHSLMSGLAFGAGLGILFDYFKQGK